MKTTKRVLAFFAAGALALSLSACTGGKSADERVAAAKETLSAATSMNSSYYTEMTYQIAEESAKSINKMELTLISAPTLRVKADISMEMEGADGQKMTMYTVEEDGASIQYLTDGTQWLKAPAEEDTAERYSVWDSIEKYLSLAGAMKEDGSETVDGRATIRLTGSISGSNLVETLESGGMLSGITTMSEDQQTKIKTDLESLSPLPISLWVDKEESYPVKFEIDFTQTLAGVQAQISKTLGGFESAETPTITGAVVRIFCSNVGTATDFELPAEAANATMVESTGDSTQP